MPYADGEAIYLIVKENKKTVRLKVVTDIGDDWVIPYWGESTTIDKSYALANIEYRDWREELVNKRDAQKNKSNNVEL